jgi:hypothetical protein
MATNTAVRLLQLPPHLIAQVMGGFDELGSLYSTILGHRAFYHTFTVHRNFILASIIRNQIPANVLPIALALCEVTHVDLVDDDAVHRLLDSMNDRLSRPSNIDIPIIPTSDFVTISSTEINRIERAVYRFQLANSLYLPDPPRKGRHDRSAHCVGKTLDYGERCKRDVKLFDTYSPWVNEQLHTIYTFLERKVCKGSS